MFTWHSNGLFFVTFDLFWPFFNLKEKGKKVLDTKENGVYFGCKSAEKYMEICPKLYLFSPIKHLFYLKKTVKIDVSTYESVQ